jgi:hypothetical protein
MSAGFTDNQVASLGMFFDDLQVKDWNALPEGDPTWGKCVRRIAEALSREQHEGYVLIKPLSTRVIAVLDQAVADGRIKQFFQEHLLTSMREVSDRRAAFANRVQVNQVATYTCLLPYSYGALVQDRYLYSENKPLELHVPIGGIDDTVSQTVAAHRHFATSECLDLFLTKAIQAEDVPLYDSLNVGGGFQIDVSSPTLRGWHEMLSTWEPTVILPDNLIESDNPIKKIFHQKVKSFRATSHERMSRSVCCLALAAAVPLLASLMLFAKSHQPN